MREIKIVKVICVNNEFQNHPAKNLLADVDVRKSWLCEKGTPKGVVLLQLECATIISSIRIGNAHSAFIEVLVGRLEDAMDKYQTLIPMSMFMNINDSKNGKKPDQVKFFYQKDFCPNVSKGKWQVLKIVCSQPFNDQVPFGVCFVKLSGIGDDPKISSSTKVEKETGIPTAEQKTIIGKTAGITEALKLMSKNPNDLSLQNTSVENLSENMQEKMSDEEVFINKKNNNPERKNVSPKKTKLLGEDQKLETSNAVEKMKKNGEQRKKRKRQVTRNRPFRKLMEDVFFMISGFKNPLRGEIRNKALKMGASYSSNWNSRSTHLICSCSKTPKYTEVKGKGKIVRKEWIEDCYLNKKRYPWRRYALDPQDTTAPESEEEIFASNDCPEIGNSENLSKERTQRHRELDPYAVPTDDERSIKPDTTDYPMPHLPEFFSGKTFYVDHNLDHRFNLERYIIAYGGIVGEIMQKDVEFYITDVGGTVLKILRKKAPKLRAVKPAWIWEVNAKSQWVSPWSFMIS